jgi:small subunit ribosomal protein S6
MRRYEQIYILHPSLSEEEISKVIENAGQVVLDDAGAVISVDKWGMRKLAYPIKKEPQGYYVLCDFAGTPAAVAEIERKLRIDDAVLKYLTVKLSDSISAEEISAAQDEAKSRAEQAAAAEAETETVEQAKTTETKGETEVKGKAASPTEDVKPEVPAEEKQEPVSE